MKIKALTLILFILLVGLINAQDVADEENTIKKNGVYVELGGNGGKLMYIGFYNDLFIESMLTINYERIIPININRNVAFRLGVGYYPQNWKLYSFPTEVTYLFGAKSHLLEMGLGVSYLVMFSRNSNSSREAFVFFGRIGYRYRGKNGLLLRAGFTPAFDHDRVFFDMRFPIFPFAGISVGYSF